MSRKPPEVRIDLRAEGPGPAIHIRLRRILKDMLRGYGLRCVAVEFLDGPALRLASDHVPEEQQEEGKAS
jgi:hypothetical protein